MYQVLISIVAFLVAIGVLIAVHEFGHFWVARRMGIKVSRFSIGFGRSLFRWYDRQGTEFVLSLIPIGGYVSLFGEGDQIIPPAERHLAYKHKSVFARMLVLLAGPGFNFIFAIFATWIIYLMGVMVFIPILGNVPKDSVAGLAGLKKGDEIVSIEGHATPSWEAVSLELLGHMGNDQPLRIVVREPEKKTTVTKTFNMDHADDYSLDTNWLENLGLVMMDPVPPIVGKVLPDYPAAKAGLKEQDLIIAVDNKPVDSRSEVTHYIQLHPKKALLFDVLRNGQKIKLTIVSGEKSSEEGQPEIGFIGVEFPALKTWPTNFVRIQEYGIGEALIKAIKRTDEFSLLTLEILKKMILGEVSARHISGPLIIAKYAGESAVIGIKQFLEFLAVISISLGVFNLLPIPLLDGGHFMYCVYESVTGRRVSDTAQWIGNWIGGSCALQNWVL